MGSLYPKEVSRCRTSLVIFLDAQVGDVLDGASSLNWNSVATQNWQMSQRDSFQSRDSFELTSGDFGLQPEEEL